MPVAATPVPWGQVEILVKAGVGARETARRLGLDENRVKAMCTRRGWKGPQAELDAAERALEQTTNKIVPNMPKAADVLASLKDDSKVKMAIAGNRAAGKLSEMDGDELVTHEVAQVAKAWSSVLSQTHEYGQTGPSSLIQLNILSGEGPSVSG